MNNLTSICNFSENLPLKRQKYFECFLEFYKVDLNLRETKRKETRLAKTWWVERCKAYNTCHLSYKATVFTFESIDKRNSEAEKFVNCYHKVLQLGCCSSPRSASEIYMMSFTNI